MRIALLPSAFAPMVGGVEELTRRLGIALTGNGHSVEVWAPVADDVGAWSTRVEDGMVVRRLQMPLWPMTITNVLMAPARFAKHLRALRLAARTFEPDVLHVLCFSGQGAYATALSAMERIPLVVSLQGETFMDANDIYGRSAQLRTALRLGLRRAAAVTGCSQYTLDDAIDRFAADASKSRVVFNGVDLHEPDSHPRPGRYVLGLGRVVREKGFDLLVDAFADIATAHPGHRLVIAGDGPERAALESQARAGGVADRVDLLGLVGRQEVASLMAGAEAVAVPSRVEPFGIVVLEAWRAGRAVIASSHGGIPEFLTDGEEGLLVDPTDITALSAALDRCLSDSDLRARLADGGARRVPAFAWNAIAAQYESVYETALAVTSRTRNRARG